MKQIPYDLYINLEELKDFFSESKNTEANVLRCGLASIDLSAYLLGSFITKETRRNKGKIAHVFKGIESQFNILNNFIFLDCKNGFKESHSKNLDNLKLLGPKYNRQIDNLTKTYFELTSKINIGLDKQFLEIRNHFDLEEILYETSPHSAQSTFPTITKRLKLNDLDYFNSEDEIFMITHQISECWFKVGINELKTINSLILDDEIYDDKINHHFKNVFDILIYLAEHILILEHMVLSVYHPLRVALRGASGGQSQQAHEMVFTSIHLFKTFLDLLKNKKARIIDVLEKPDDNHFLLSAINHFSKLERSLKNFFFQHYVLSSSVIGSQSFGSIGFDLVSLVDKFVEPIFKEIDQAKYDLTLKTNFQYGESSGILILNKEKIDLQADQVNTPKIEIKKKAIDAYFDAISHFDQNKWVSLFSVNGYIEDPIGSRPYLGHKQLSIFFKGVLRFFAKLDMRLEEMQILEKCTEVSWKANAITYNGKQITFEGKEVFEINNEGKIMVAQVHWDPSVIAMQL